ncbi:MAG TPA: DEAD/DEAH box helicase, partial [Mycobacterium sp.]|nr:DEAD/DEAH box helicase [Mycobacterium sp.]
MTPLTTHPQISFAQLGVRDEIVRALAEQGIEHAFAIQELTLPLALSGDDLIGQARTGMGKTFAFGVPLLHRITTDTTRPLNGTPRALVVVPTRELCLQVFGDLEGAAKYLQAEGDRPLSVVSIYGGRPYEPQIESLRKGADVVVGTPGRLLDLAQQGHLQLGGLSVLVLDEADEMLDLGFLPDIERILRQIPDERQAMLFSATMPDPIITLARTFMNQPTHIRAEGVQGAATHDTTEQFVYRAHALDKVEMVSRILQAEGRGATMIFTRTKRTAQKVADELAERGFKVGAVHGDLGQIAREKALKAFRAGDVDVLVATDVAARGIDIDDITHVINYQIPEDEQAYVHRIGRTGRAGKTGIAITLVDWDELDRWSMIDKALKLECPDPAETYSNSPHLYSELGIPAEATGSIGTPRKQRQAKSQDGTRISSADA